ncbi:MAG: ribosome biogenesis GTPase YlqF [Bacteriovoracaceae bacterium]
MHKKKTGIEHLEQNHINWFPGHMNKAIKEIKKNIKSVNIVIEVRDARAPLASGNKRSYADSNGKPYLIVFNKANLADPKAVELWKNWLAKNRESFVFINAFDKNSIETIIDRARAVLNAHRLKSNASTEQKQNIRMIVLGLPNTGKSTIINKLAGRNATKAAPNPGQTKMQIWVKVDNDIELLDTPGVMPPRITQQVHAMWLSAIHAIPDHVVTPDDSACFLIEHFIKNKSTSFMEHYKLDFLEVDLLGACDHIGQLRGCLQKGGGYDYDHIYKIVLNDFRKGALGPTSFELPPSRSF